MQDATIDPTRPVKPARGSLQFSIRSLLIATTIVAALITCANVPPLAGISIILLYTVCVVCAAVAAISGRGWIRPFAITGGGYWLLAAIIMTGFNGPPFGLFMLGLFNLAIGTLIGFCGAAFHGFLVRRNGIIPIPNIPVLRNWLKNPPVDIH